MARCDVRPEFRNHFAFAGLDDATSFRRRVWLLFFGSALGAAALLSQRRWRCHAEQQNKSAMEQQFFIWAGEFHELPPKSRAEFWKSCNHFCRRVSPYLSRCVTRRGREQKNKGRKPFMKMPKFKLLAAVAAGADRLTPNLRADKPRKPNRPERPEGGRVAAGSTGDGSRRWPKNSTSPPIRRPRSKRR